MNDATQNPNETISAIATAAGPAGVGIVRISGPAAIPIARALSHRRHLPDRTLVLATLRAPESQAVVDEGFVCAMRAPRSFTGEDVVELHVHGGVRNMARVLDATLSAGARLAQAGEFTRRAVLNGKLDIPRAEALLDIVEARTDAALELAHAQRGGLGQVAGSLASRLERCLVQAEADLDFPDEEEPTSDRDELARETGAVAGELESLAATFRVGRVVRDGFRVVLTGAPNAGKSTLFNALLGDDRAIVTEIAGTTRDFLEETVEIAGLPFVLVDTAGLCDTEDPVEREGVERARRAAQAADLVLLVVAPGATGERAPEETMAKLPHENTVVVFTKADLASATEPSPLPGCPSVSVSARTGDGLEALQDFMVARALPEGMPGALGTVVTNARQHEAVLAAAESLRAAESGFREELPLEFPTTDLRRARRHLAELTGEFATDDLLDRVFSQFCISK